MRLNAQTDFSLRLLMYLAAKDSRSATIHEVSKRLNLSQTHMMRVAAKLAAHGFLSTNRGRLGGISLAKPAAQITVEDVLRAIEPDFSLVTCFGKSEQACSIEYGCLLKGALNSALDAFFSELRTISLDQLAAGNRGSLNELVRLSPLSTRAQTA